MRPTTKEVQKARKISELIKEIDHINKKIEFASRGYKDEFYLAKSETSKFSEHTNNVPILSSDLEILITGWNDRLCVVENALKEVIK